MRDQKTADHDLVHHNPFKEQKPGHTKTLDGVFQKDSRASGIRRLLWFLVHG